MAGLFSSAGLFGSNSTPAQVVTTNPYDQMVAGGQSGNFGDLANSNSTYLADLFSQLGTGQTPSYYQKYQSQAQPYQQGLLNQQFFGTPGNRMQQMGVNGQSMGPSGIGNAMTMASMYGLNPKATTGMVNKNQLAYQNASSMLDNYFAGQGLNVINQTAQSLPGWATGQQNALTDAFRPTTNAIPAQAGSLGLFGSMITNAAGQLMGGGMGGGSSSGGGMADSFGNYAGGVNAGAAAQPYLSGPMSLSQGGAFAAAPMAF